MSDGNFMLRYLSDHHAASTNRPTRRNWGGVRFVVVAILLAILLSGNGFSPAERATAQTTAATEGDYQPRSASSGEGYTDSQDAALGYRYSNEPSAETYQPSYSPSGEYRQPVAIEFIHDRLAIVPTRLTGELFALALPEFRLHRVVHDPVRRWGKLARLSEGAFAVIDQAASQVVVFEEKSEKWSIVAQLNCPGTPNSLVWAADFGQLYVSGQWSQRLYRFQTDPELQAFASWETLPWTDLPMCGGVILPLPKHEVILVMDAFGRDFAVVDETSAKLLKHDKVYGHNISQIVALEDEQRVMFTHQLLNEFAQSMRGDITWGGLLSNNIRWLRTERMLTKTGSEIFSQGRFYPVGATGDGAGDPTSFRLTAEGALAITLGGTDRIAIGNLRDLDLRQLAVGHHPVACSFTPDQRHVIVVNQFSDNLSVIDLSDDQVQHLPLGELRPPTASERGERFFFHSKLSHDGWMSCHSCHSQGHTNGQLNDNLTDGSFGTPKRIPSLLGQADTAPYSWSGKLETLEDQIVQSIRSTMATDNPIQPSMVADLASFIRQLPEPPSLLEARGDPQTSESVAQRGLGKELFRSLGCADCHAGNQYTTLDAFDVGLVDEQGMKLFNPPSLRSLSQRHNALFHDGRAGSIRSVVEEFQHQLPRSLSAEEQESLILFLRAL